MSNIGDKTNDCPLPVVEAGVLLGAIIEIEQGDVEKNYLEVIEKIKKENSQLYDLFLRGFIERKEDAKAGVILYSILRAQALKDQTKRY